jgi:hypothetical protein
MFEPRPVTVTLDRRRLTEVLDIVADAADAVETLHGDPDLVRAVRYAIAEFGSDLDTADDPVQALQLQLSELERNHVDQRETTPRRARDLGAAVPVACTAAGAPCVPDSSAKDGPISVPTDPTPRTPGRLIGVPPLSCSCGSPRTTNRSRAAPAPNWPSRTTKSPA